MAAKKGIFYLANRLADGFSALPLLKNNLNRKKTIYILRPWY